MHACHDFSLSQSSSSSSSSSTPPAKLRGKGKRVETQAEKDEKLRLQNVKKQLAEGKKVGRGIQQISNAHSKGREFRHEED